MPAALLDQVKLNKGWWGTSGTTMAPSHRTSPGSQVRSARVDPVGPVLTAIGAAGGVAGEPASGTSTVARKGLIMRYVMPGVWHDGEPQ